MNPRMFDETKVAFFMRCQSKSGGVNVSLGEIIDGTRSGKWAHLVKALRRVPYKSEAYEQAKLKLPCFMLSATTATGGHKAADIAAHTGLLQIDVDGVGEPEAAIIRDRLGSDPHVLAAWLSPGANGVKAAALIPANLDGHRAAFGPVKDYLAKTYGIAIDPKCSDPCRLCFVSVDPELRFNPDATPFRLLTGAPPGSRLKKPGRAPLNDSSSSLSPDSESASYLLHNNVALFQDFPALLPFFDQHVRRKLGTPARGLRNAALVELVAGTFCVVQPRFVLAFADLFHREHPQLFSDYPHEQWMREADSALTGCLSAYAKKNLGPGEAAIYELLLTHEDTAAFRICRSLAACETDPATPPPEFFLSAVQLGSRLGVLDMQAWRIQQQLEKKGAIATVVKGTRRQAGEKAQATRYRWLFPLRNS